MSLKTPRQLLIMKWLLLALLVLPLPLSAASAVEFLGRFTHEGLTEEHRYIYQLDLWREGEKLFGFYAFHAGLQGDPIRGMHSMRIAGELKGESVLLKRENGFFSFSGNLSGRNLSGRWSDSMTNDKGLTLHKLAAAATEPALLRASLGSYEAWAQWAEHYLDGKDADNRALQQDLANCARGDGQACLRAGIHSKLRGNHERARQRFEAGCELNDPTSCRNVGRVERARQINESRCTGKATMENNFACQALGEQEEKAGNLLQAKAWYRKGCNTAIPLVCQQLKRLEDRK